jgi:hypothetical protein
VQIEQMADLLSEIDLAYTGVTLIGVEGVDEPFDLGGYLCFSAEYDIAYDI